MLWIHVETELGSLDVPAGWNIWAHRGMMGEPVFGLTPDGHRGFAVVVHAQPAAVFDAHQDTVAAWLVRNAFLEPLDPGWAVTDWTCPSVGAGGSARESVTCVEGRAGPNIEVACSAVDDREMVYASARVQQGEVMEAIGGVSTLARIAASTAGLVQ